MKTEWGQVICVKNNSEMPHTHLWFPEGFFAVSRRIIAFSFSLFVFCNTHRYTWKEVWINKLNINEFYIESAWTDDWPISLFVLCFVCFAPFLTYHDFDGDHFGKNFLWIWKNYTCVSLVKYKNHVKSKPNKTNQNNMSKIQMLQTWWFFPLLLNALPFSHWFSF